MSALGPRMNGASSVAELCEGLDESRRRTAVALMKALLDKGFARDVPQSDDKVLDSTTAELFAPQVNFIEHFMHADQRTPQELFARFRSSRVLVSGPPGDVLAAAVRGLLRNGLAEVFVDDASWGREFDGEIARLADAGTPAKVVVLPLPPADLAAFDVVVCAVDGAHSRGLLDLTKRVHGAEAGPRLLPVVSDRTRVVVGPISGPADQPCWLCAQLRLSANCDPRLAADYWRALAVGPAAGEPEHGSAVARSMVGNAVAFEIFRLGSGQLQPDDQRHAVIQDLTTLESRRERVLPHPGCPLRHARVDSDGNGPTRPADDSEAYGRAAVLVSPDVGVMSGWADESFKQIPLKMGRVRLGPAGALTDGHREIAAFDTDTILVARTRAVRAAVSCYVGRLGPVGAAGTSADEAAALLPAGRLEVFGGLAGEREWSGGITTPAVSLHDGSTWLVPAAAAYPLSPANARLRFEPTSAGAAADWTLEAVREQGLCSALAYRGLVRALTRETPATRVGDSLLAGDDEVAFALGSLRHIGREARVYALPGAAPAFTVLAVVEGGEEGAADWAVGSALSARAALRDAVRDAVGLAVSRHYEGTPADPGDPLLADLDPRALLEGEGVAEWSLDGPATPVPQALARLDADGTRALFVETTTIDLHAVRGMVTGTVLLAAQ